MPSHHCRHSHQRLISACWPATSAHRSPRRRRRMFSPRMSLASTPRNVDLRARSSSRSWMSSMSEAANGARSRRSKASRGVRKSVVVKSFAPSRESILLRLLLMLRLLLRLLQQRRRPPRNSPPDHTDSSSKTRAERRSTPLNPSRSPRSPSPSPHRRPLPPPLLFPLRVLIPHYRTNSSNSSKVCRRRRRKSTIPAC